jgi:hypothetical protein
MRAYWILLPALLAGCATHQRSVRAPAREAGPPNQAIPERTATRLVETRYELREYHDASDPTVRHDSHAVYRATRVPIRPDGAQQTLATLPRASFAPASYSPLPQNTEMSAELATQKRITSELRTIQAAMSATQKDAQEKFGELVNQTAETIKLRRDLEEERARVKQLEARMRDRSNEAATTAGTPVAADAKW